MTNKSNYVLEKRRNGYRGIMVWISPSTNEALKKLQSAGDGANITKIISSAIKRMAERVNTGD